MSDDTRQLLRAAYDALNRLDLDAFLELVHPDVEFTSLIAEAEGRTYRGHAGVREWWEQVPTGLDGLRYELEVVHDLDDRAYTQILVTATAGGVDVPQRMWQTIRLAEDARAIWWAAFRTEAEAREALGLEPSGDDRADAEANPT